MIFDGSLVADYSSDVISLSTNDRLIIGVVVGSVLFLLLILITIIVCKKRQQRGNATKRMMVTNVDDDFGDKLEMSPVMVTNIL